jgi:hypothetical protein
LQALKCSYRHKAGCENICIMEKKDQNNQNPATVQEEKPRTETTAPTSKQSDTLLSKEDKNEIRKMIRSVAEKPIEKLSETTKTKTRRKKQINKALKEKILQMIRDNHLLEEKNVSEKKKTSVPSPAISETDKIYILNLLRDTVKKISKKETESDQEDIDYDQLNKQELVEILEEVVQEKDTSRIKDQVARIKLAFYRLNKEEIDHQKQDFIANGGKEEDFQHLPDPLEKRFSEAFSVYKHNRARYTEELERQKQENLKKKQQILEELKELINSEETLKKTYDEFRHLQEKWKEIGVVPVSELNNLWQNYHFLVEKFFDKVRINKELRDLDLKKNLEQKLALCEKAEALLEEKSIIASFKKLQQYHDEWREIGPVPRDMKEPLWERFKAATDKINQKRREHYKELHEEQERNYEAKVALCEEAEKLLEEEKPGRIKEWQKLGEKFDDLLARWKSTGRAPKAKNDLIWKRFKTSLDTFYANKRAFFQALKESQMENYNKKLKLCEQAEAIKESTDWKKTTNELIRLQKEWKEIGPVPRKYSDKVWKRFRAACDEFFNRKSEFYKNNHKEEEENLKKKEQLVAEMESFEIKDKKEENLAALKDFQQKWLDIGHVPFQEKDKIYKKYREAYEKLLTKMHLSQTEIAAQGFVTKLEALKKSPEGEHRLLRERSALQAKMKKLQEDIALWENNIGFFSSASSLVSGFEKKIERAKKDLALLKNKIRLIDKEL